MAGTGLMEKEMAAARGSPAPDGAIQYAGGLTGMREDTHGDREPEGVSQALRVPHRNHPPADCGGCASVRPPLPSYSSSTSPSITSSSSTPGTESVARTGSFSLPDSFPSSSPARTARSISRWAVMPKRLRNWRMVRLKVSSFMAELLLGAGAGRRCEAWAEISRKRERCGSASQSEAGREPRMGTAPRGADTPGAPFACTARAGALVHGDAQPQLAHVRIRVRGADREPVPERSEAQVTAHPEVIAEPQHRADAGLAVASEAVDRGMHGPEPEATGEEEGAGFRRIEAQARIERPDGERGTLLGAGPAGGADGEEQLGAQRATEREAATQPA